MSDTGRYVCAAENVAGSADKSFNVNVHGESPGHSLLLYRIK